MVILSVPTASAALLSPIVPVAAAIGNAIADAIGSSVNRIPILPDDILGALGAREPALTFELGVALAGAVRHTSQVIAAARVQIASIISII